MSNNITGGDNRSEIDNSNDSFDRDNNCWILNLLLNIKSQKDIAQDIANGIFQMSEIEKIFPLDYVEELLSNNNESTQNYLNRFKHMTGERIKGILNTVLKGNKKNKLINEIADRFVKYGTGKLLNIADNLKDNIKNMNSKSKSKNSLTTIPIPGKLKSGNILETKNKRITKKNSNVDTNKKDEKTKKINDNTKKLTKKKLAVNVNDGNKFEESTTSSSMTNQTNDENISKNLIDMSNSFNRDGSKESSFDDKDKEKEKDRLKVVKTTIVNKNSIKKNAQDNKKKKIGGKKSNVLIENISSNNDNLLDKMIEIEEEEEELQINDNTKNDEKEILCNDCSSVNLISKIKDNLTIEKSALNETTNISNTMNENKEISYNRNDKEMSNIQIHTEMDTSTPKKLNTMNVVVKVKEEPIQTNFKESNSNEFNYFTNEKKDNVLKNKSNKSSNSNARIKIKSKVVRSNNNQSKKKLDKREIISSYKKKNFNQEVNDCNKGIPIEKSIELIQQKISNIQSILNEFKGPLTKLNKMHKGEESSDSLTDYNSVESSSRSLSTESSSYSLSESYSKSYSYSSEGCECSSCNSYSTNDSSNDSSSKSDNDYCKCNHR